jgi:hypothetical protein
MRLVVMARNVLYGWQSNPINTEKAGKQQHAAIEYLSLSLLYCVLLSLPLVVVSGCCCLLFLRLLLLLLRPQLQLLVLFVVVVVVVVVVVGAVLLLVVSHLGRSLFTHCT